MPAVTSLGGYLGFGRQPVPRVSISVNISPSGVGGKNTHDFDLDGDLVISSGNTAHNAPGIYTITSARPVTLGVAAWGGGGGGTLAQPQWGGPGGAVMGFISIPANKTITIAVGSAGITGISPGRFGGGGGAATVIHDGDINKPILVAGGGGGGAAATSNELIDFYQYGNPGGVARPDYFFNASAPLSTNGQDGQPLKRTTDINDGGTNPLGSYNGGDGGWSAFDIGESGDRRTASGGGGGGFPFGGNAGAVTGRNQAYGGQGGNNFSNIAGVKSYDNFIGWTNQTNSLLDYEYSRVPALLDMSKAVTRLFTANVGEKTYQGNANVGGLVRFWLYEHTAVGFNTDANIAAAGKIVTEGITPNGAIYTQVKFNQSTTFTIQNARPTDTIEILSVGSGGAGVDNDWYNNGGSGGDAGDIKYEVMPAFNGTYIVNVGKPDGTLSEGSDYRSSFILAPTGTKYGFAAGGVTKPNFVRTPSIGAGLHKTISGLKNLFADFSTREFLNYRIGTGGNRGIYYTTSLDDYYSYIGTVTEYPSRGYGAGVSGDDGEPNSGAGGGGGIWSEWPYNKPPGRNRGLGGSGTVFIRYCTTSEGIGTQYLPAGSLYASQPFGLLINHQIDSAKTTPWTIEFWAFRFQVDEDNFILEEYFNGSTGNTTKRIVFSSSSGFNQGNRISVYGRFQNPERWSGVVTAKDAPLLKWFHVAIVFDGQQAKIYLDGEESTTPAGTPGLAFQPPVNEWIPTESSNRVNLLRDFKGYIANFRYVIGTAVYNANFTPSYDVPEVIKSDTAPIIRTVAVLGYDPNSPIIEAQNLHRSTNELNRVINLDNNYSQSSNFVPTAYNPLTDWSFYVRTKRSALVEFPTNTKNAVQFGTGDFTIELFVYPAMTPTSSWTTILTIGRAASDSEIRIAQNLSGEGWGFYIPTTGIGIVFGKLQLNVWHHIALVRSGTNIFFYQNGARIRTIENYNYNFSFNGNVRIGGGFYAGDTEMNGYISNVRILKGRALYTEPVIEVPTAKLEVIDDTVLLTAQDSTFIDKSTNNFAPVVSGDITTSPFGPMESTRARNLGFSSEFVGNSSTVQVFPSTDTNYNLSSNTLPFTIEFWMYPRVGGVKRLLYYETSPGNTTGIWQFFLNNTNRIEITHGLLSPQQYILNNTVLAMNQWHHVALVKTITSPFGTPGYTVYVNGNPGTVLENATGLPYSLTGTLSIGGRIGESTWFFDGFLSHVRIHRNRALYTEAFGKLDTPIATTAGEIVTLINY